LNRAVGRVDAGVGAEAFVFAAACSEDVAESRFERQIHAVEASIDRAMRNVNVICLDIAGKRALNLLKEDVKASSTCLLNHNPAEKKNDVVMTKLWSPDLRPADISCLLRSFDNADKGSNGNGRRAFRLVRLRIITPRRAGDIEVSPFCFIDKFLDKDGSHNSSGFHSRPNVLDVRDVGFYSLAVFFSERKLPVIFADILADIADLVDEFLIVAHDACVVVAESDDDRAGERRHIYDAGCAKLFGVGDRVGENKTAFGIRIKNFDRFAVHRLDDIARPRGSAVGHIFNGSGNAYNGNARFQ
jgi:hypothetical protein